MKLHRSSYHNDVIIRICALELPNIVDIKTSNSTALLTENGILSKVLLIILEHLGWRYELESPLTKTNKLINGTLTGCLLKLQNNLSDVYLPGVTTSAKNNRFQMIPVLFDNVPFFVRVPGLNSEFSALARPFSIKVWIFVGITLIIGTFVFYLTATAYQISKSGPAKKPQIYNIFWDLLYSLCGKGIHIFNYVIGSSAFFVLGWILGIFVLTNAYSGALMSCITFPGLKFVPRTYSELLTNIEANAFDASIPKGSPLVELMKLSPNQGIQRHLSQLMNAGKIVELFPDKGMERVMKGNHAMIIYKLLGEVSINSENKGDIIESEEHLFTSSAGLLTRRNSPYFERLYLKVQRCIEAGIVNKITSDKTENWRKTVPKSRHTDWGPLTLIQLQGPFLILIFGHLLASASLTAEMLIFKVFRVNTNATNKT